MNSGKPIVVDASAFLAVLFAEPTADWVAEQLQAHATVLMMSTVNAAEVLMLLRNRREGRLVEMERLLLVDSGFHFIAPTLEHARRAAEARHRFHLNLGDCFAYALSAAENCPVLTLNEDFRRCDRPVLMPSPQ